MPTLQETINSKCWKQCPCEEQFVRMARENISLEEVEKLYTFLQSEIPERFYFKPEEMPKLTADQAFAVIYYLQEGMGILPDTYEKCHVPGCDELFDSDTEGCRALFCESCGCQHPDGYDPYEEGCDACPILLREEESEGKA